MVRVFSAVPKKSVLPPLPLLSGPIRCPNTSFHNIGTEKSLEYRRQGAKLKCWFFSYSTLLISNADFVCRTFENISLVCGEVP